MIKVDFSKAVQLRFGIYLLGLIPGVFFELCIAMGNPPLAASVISSLHQIYPFGAYSLLFLFLTSSWFVGSGFFFAAWITEQLVFYGFALSRYAIRITFGSQWLYHRLGILQGFPPKQTFFLRSLSKLIFWARQREFSTEARPALKCLRRATKQLLKVGYGLDISHELQSDGSEWEAWYSVLGKPLRGIQEAVIACRTVLGCGLAGFTALYASPALRERYFIGLCFVFAASGFFYSFNIARWTFNPVRRSLLRLKSISLELSEVTTLTVMQKAKSANRLRPTTEASEDAQE